MNIKALITDEPNTGKLKYKTGFKTVVNDGTSTSTKTEFDIIEIKSGRYIQNGISHPLHSENEKYFHRVYCFDFEGKQIYFFNSFGKNDGISGFHVGFTWWQHQRFLYLQKRHWIQKEENVRYIVNVIFLVLGLIIGIKSI